MESAMDMQPAWQRFGLVFQPFSGRHRSLAYCHVPSVERLTQWIEGQVAPWLMVTGPMGSGKSAFVTDWVRRHRQRCIRLQGTEGASVQNLQKKLRIHCPSQGDQWSLSEDLAHIRYILIDDAHRLPQATQAWLQQQKWPASLQFMLFTESKFTWDVLCDVVHFEIKPWSLDDIGFYCMKRLRQAGWQSDLPELKRSVLQALLRETEGLVASLDEAVESHWPWQEASPNKAASSRLQIKALHYRIPRRILCSPRGVSIMLILLCGIGSMLHIIVPFGDHMLLQHLADKSDWVVGQLLHIL